MVGASGALNPGNEPTVPIILVVEDEVLVRMMVVDELRNAGFVVIEASSAHEACDVLAHRADIRLVLSDMRMPGSLDGVGLARLVRSKYPAIKVVLTSGHIAAIDWAEHDGFFPKPYDSARVIRHIRTLLD